MGAITLDGVSHDTPRHWGDAARPPQTGPVRMYAAKAIAWIGDPRAIAPVAEILANAKAEADYGWSKTWKDEEFNDPCPRWRESLLGRLMSFT